MRRGEGEKAAAAATPIVVVAAADQAEWRRGFRQPHLVLERRSFVPEVESLKARAAPSAMMRGVLTKPRQLVTVPPRRRRRMR